MRDPLVAPKERSGEPDNLSGVFTLKQVQGLRVLILGCASHLDAFSGYHLGM